MLGAVPRLESALASPSELKQLDLEHLWHPLTQHRGLEARRHDGEALEVLRA